MRPIDADRLYNEILSKSISVGGKQIFHPAVKESVLDAIEMSETLDYAPVKRGRPGIALVEHHVSDDPVYCEHSHPDDGFMEYSLCSYLKNRDRHGKKGRIDRGLPRCTLFNEWLEKDGYKHRRCNACKKACGAKMDGKEDGKDV